RGNAERARYRKVSALRSFFGYMTKVTHNLEIDPAKDIEIPSPKKSLPKFLSLDESRRLLDSADNDECVRDYCILTLFLNCGMRLSELVRIDIAHIDFNENCMKVLGKGNKERMIYLNNACVDSLKRYLEIRLSNEKASGEPALFISRQNKRISKRRVQQIVDYFVEKSGLDGKGITTHKLRHTAATLMYQYGGADMLTLKEVLGHENINTTEIYVHLADESVRNAVENNPLADITRKK
ncbi:MAG: tyrosine-type recombinase/integrase, partial [Ruminococcus sp.]|nr:tyrosine-type recombinase/integrase [Ruminococcus sp.]